MTIIARIQDFIAKEDGAVSADFILLTGFAVTACMVTFGGISAATLEVANMTSSMLASGALLDLVH